MADDEPPRPNLLDRHPDWVFEKETPRGNLCYINRSLFNKRVSVWVENREDRRRYSISTIGAIDSIDNPENYEALIEKVRKVVFVSENTKMSETVGEFLHVCTLCDEKIEEGKCVFEHFENVHFSARAVKSASKS